MNTYKAFRIYLIIYFMLPSAGIYLAAITGVRVPVVLEIIPVLMLLLGGARTFRANGYDVLFVIPLAAIFILIIVNIHDQMWIFNIEVRGLITISVSYYILRVLVKEDWIDGITNTILFLLKLSMYLLPLEFILINYNDRHLASILQSGYLAAFPERERLYEGFLLFLKPIGLFPGTHNAAIASAILLAHFYSLNTMRGNKLTIVMTICSFILGGSLTALLTLFIILVSVESLRRLRTVNIKSIVWISFLFAFLVFGTNFLLSNQEAITHFRSTAEVIERPSGISISDSVYMESVTLGIDSAIKYPFGLPFSVDFTNNEVYWSRVAMYFGFPMMFFFLICTFIVFAKMNKQSLFGRFYGISVLTLFVSSFHYPSIIYYPLNILFPLAFVFMARSNKVPGIINDSLRLGRLNDKNAKCHS